MKGCSNMSKNTTNNKPQTIKQESITKNGNTPTKPPASFKPSPPVKSPK